MAQVSRNESRYKATNLSMTNVQLLKLFSLCKISGIARLVQVLLETAVPFPFFKQLPP